MMQINRETGKRLNPQGKKAHKEESCQTQGRGAKVLPKQD